MATSVPVPMAIPMSAFLMAGASLTPSPGGSPREAKDVWTERIRLLAPYQVNADLMRMARNHAVKFMDCLPAFHEPRNSPVQG